MLSFRMIEKVMLAVRFHWLGTFHIARHDDDDDDRYSRQYNNNNNNNIVTTTNKNKSSSPTPSYIEWRGIQGAAAGTKSLSMDVDVLWKNVRGWA